jgi:hypothetical protein
VRSNWQNGIYNKKYFVDQAWLFMSVILAIQKVEIRRIAIQDQQEQKLSETPFSINKQGIGHIPQGGDR